MSVAIPSGGQATWSDIHTAPGVFFDEIKNQPGRTASRPFNGPAVDWLIHDSG